MFHETGKRLPKSGERKSTMNGTVADIAEAQSLIQAAFPVSVHGKCLTAWWAAKRKLGLPTISRAETIWKAKARRIESWEMDALREAAIVRLEERLSAREEIKDRIAALKARTAVSRQIPPSRLAG